MISASTANMADVEHVYIWYFLSLSSVYDDDDDCTVYVNIVCVVLCSAGTMLGWLSSLLLFSLWLTVCLWWLCFNCIVYEVDERTKRTDEGCWCSTDKNVVLRGRGGLLRRYAMLCYAMRTGCVERIMCEWVCVRAGVWVCVWNTHWIATNRSGNTPHARFYLSKS